MTTQQPLPFIKMNGIGNDFVIFDARQRPLTFTPEGLSNIANREQGIGCDQIIVLENSDKADVFMRIYNANGGQVDACGNASRCVGWLMSQEKGKKLISIETNAGILQSVAGDDENVAVDMGQPKFDWQDIPLSEEFADTSGIELQLGPIDDPVLHTPSVVNVGNPHCIFWVDNLDDHDLTIAGSFLETHFMFPEHANISLAQVEGDTIHLRVWERGAGLTKACGTAACAAGVSAARKELTGRRTTVILPGGPLHIHWRETDNHIIMTGATELEAVEAIDPADFGIVG